ncbi:MAG: hypothetical protein ACKVZ0_15525 [Gemmatimonadales bacterium]
MPRSRLLALALLALPGTLPAQAATPANPVLNIVRETVKVGKSVAHNAHETAWAKAVTTANTPDRYIAMSSVTGPSEVWYVSIFPSWAARQKNNEAVDANAAAAAANDRFSTGDAEFLTDSRTMTLRPRPELDYGAPADLPKMRFVSVTRISVRPGHTQEFEDARKMIKAAHEAAQLSDGYSIWEATSGAPAGTFYMFVARKSLAELDDAGTIHGAGYRTALGGEEGQKKLAALMGSAVMGQQTDHFAFTPSQSLPPANYLTADPDFWKPKAGPAKKTP